MPEYGPAARAQVAAAVAQRDVAQFAAALVGTTSTRRPARDRIREVRHLRALALEALDRTVITARLEGTSWEELGAALLLDPDTARVRYEAAVTRWSAPGGSAASGPGDPGDPDVAGTAELLDAWYAAANVALDPQVDEPVDRPVSRILHP
ncbi:hypothetical protein [Streptomyces sp. MJM8645]|uniref:hypothetical protein n=1 Tax=Streptomycetaceae TaxID=2062 RepID=UPI0007AFCE88|nr:hypothetical protein [Streptomyces sp. MJM8645]